VRAVPRGLGLAGMLALVGGCDATLCGAGTIEAGGLCVPLHSPLCGNGTLLMGNECRPDPAWTGPQCGQFTKLVGDPGEQQCVVDGTMLPPSAGKVISVDLGSPYRADGISIGELGDVPLSTAYANDSSVVIMGFLDDGTGEGTGYVWGGVGQLDEESNLYFLEPEYAFLEPVSWVDVAGTPDDPLDDQLQTIEPFVLFVRISSEPNVLRLDEATITSIDLAEDSDEVVESLGFTGTVSLESASKINLRETGGTLDSLLTGTYEGINGTVPDTAWIFDGTFGLAPKVVSYP
jgi:hypothetical protein